MRGRNWQPSPRAAHVIYRRSRATAEPSFSFATRSEMESIMLAISSLTRFAIEAKVGSIGKNSDFLFDNRTWKLRWMVVDTGGWLTWRKALVHRSAGR